MLVATAILTLPTAAMAATADELPACGGHLQRACCFITGESTTACDSGGTEVVGCTEGDCTCGGANPLNISATSRCVNIPTPDANPACGGNGQRACCSTTSEATGACDSGATEILGCSGDCTCGGLNPLGISATSVCRIIPTPDANSGCGGPNQRACCSTTSEATGACDSNTTEVVGCSGIDCTCGGVNPLNISATSICRPVTPCGGPNQRGCCPTDVNPAGCQAGLAEVFGCGPAGECLCAGGIGFPSSTTCYPVSPCGGRGQRSCCLGEGEGCRDGLQFVAGCSGDCTCAGELQLGGLQKSAGTCAVQEAIAEPTINGTLAQVGPRCPLRGYMDMHLHLSADLAHGGAVLGGAAYDPIGGINAALGPDYATNDDIVGLENEELPNVTCPPGFPNCGTKPFHLEHGLFEEPLGSELATRDGATGPLVGVGGGGFLGAPSFGGWPKYSTTTHQQSYYKWLERAWRSGLRLITMLAVSNTALCKTNNRLRGTDCDDIMGTIDIQIEDAYRFQAFIDDISGGEGTGWFRIVTTPQQAREVIASGKLAVVLGIEVDHLFNCRFPREACTTDGGFLESCNPALMESVCTEEYVTAEIDRYYAMGVRHVFPIHNFDNSFGGTATWQDGIEAGNRAIEGHWWDVRECANEGYSFGLEGATQALLSALKFDEFIDFGELLGYSRPESASCNTFGLFPLGRHLLNRLMDRGMIIDIDHMSARAFSEAMDIAESRAYPAMVASHVQFMDLNKGGPEGNRHERMRTYEQLQRIRNVGGMIATMTKDDVVDSGRRGQKFSVAYGKVADDCKHSSKVFAQMYEYSIDVMGGPVALGSDFNGIAGHVAPRFGSEACGGDVDERSAESRFGTRLSYPFTIPEFGTFSQQITGQKTYDYNVDGLAHIGLLPDMIADLRVVGLTDTDLDPMFRGAQAYVDMWDKASGTFTPAPTAACASPTVVADASCRATATVAVGAPESDGRVTASISPAGPYGLGSTSVSVSVDDLCGPNGVTSCTGTVTVVDQTPPSVACPASRTVECTGPTTAVSYGNATVSDNCGALPATCLPASGSAFGIGTTTVGCAATDTSGNPGSCGFGVTVVDTMPPTAICRNVVVDLDASGNGSTSAAALDGGSADACSSVSLSASPTAFTCANVGAASAVLIATDSGGRWGQCTSAVTVRDPIAPTAVCRNASVTLDPNGTTSVAAATIDAGSNDACGLSGLALSRTTFACTDAGNNSVQLTATDNSGNQHACSATVTVLKRASRLVLGGAGAGQYSDAVPLRATLTDLVTGGGLVGRTILFSVGARSATATTGVDGVAAAPASLAAGEAGAAVVVSAAFAGDCTYDASNDTGSRSIGREDAALELSPANPSSVRAVVAGGAEASLTVFVREAQPDQPEEGGALPGDIRLADTMMELVALGAGRDATGVCAAQNSADLLGNSYDDVIEVRCDFADLDAGRYEVRASVGGFYTGSTSGGLLVFDPLEVTLDRASAWAWRNPRVPGRARARGTVRFPAGDVAFDGVEVVFRDAQDLEERSMFPSCRRFADGGARCLSEEGPGRIRFRPVPGDVGLYDYKVDVYRREISQPQVGPLEVAIKLGLARGGASVGPCRLFSKRLDCRGTSMPVDREP